MGFSHLFILQLRSWPHWSRTSWFGLRTSLTFWSLTFCFSIYWPLTSYLYLYIPRPPWAFGGDVTSWHPRSSHALLRGRHLPVPFAKPSPTSTLCKADTYQYPLRSRHLPVLLRSQHLPVLIARPSSTTSTLWYEMMPSIGQGADFSIVRGAVFSIVRGSAFSIVRGGAFQYYGLHGDVGSEPFA